MVFTSETFGISFCLARTTSPISSSFPNFPHRAPRLINVTQYSSPGASSKQRHLSVVLLVGWGGILPSQTNSSPAPLRVHPTRHHFVFIVAPPPISVWLPRNTQSPRAWQFEAIVIFSVISTITFVMVPLSNYLTVRASAVHTLVTDQEYAHTNDNPDATN